MKVFIPFNSNDFNSVFTTLSISPCYYYPNRKYSFKRATTTFLNENEDFLVGFEKPLFHNREFDKEYGFPVLIEIEIEKSKDEWQETENGIKYVLIENTVFLLNNFKLIFRREKELKETFAKSLKSIETKYTSLAKQNSEVVKGDCFVSELPSLYFPSVNNNFNSLTFYKERRLNRMLGVTLGSSIACANLTTKEWQEISVLLRYLNNNLSLFLNKVTESNEYEKKHVLEIIDKILNIHETHERLEETIMLGSDSSFRSDLLNTLKQTKIFNVSAFSLILEGLMVSSKVELPLSLKLEKLKRIINSKYNSKYPQKYIEQVNNIFTDVKNTIEYEVRQGRKNNKLTLNSLVRPNFVNDKLELKLPEGLLENESKYLKQCLKFFIETNNISDLETFFTNRKKILTELAIHFKDTIENFSGSNEREYLALLLNSFDSLRGGFEVSRTSNEVLKSIAVLFTSGRDLMRFIENNEKEEIQNSLIYYTIWGSIYGAAMLPKTLTEIITEDNSNVKVLISAYADTIKEYQKELERSYLENEVHNETTELGKKEQIDELLTTYPIESRKVKLSPEKNSQPISFLANQILEQVETKRKIKLADLKSLSKSFKTNSDIEKLIINHLLDRIKLTKKGSTMYAEIIESVQLKFN